MQRPQVVAVRLGRRGLGQDEAQDAVFLRRLDGIAVDVLGQRENALIVARAILGIDLAIVFALLVGSVLLVLVVIGVFVGTAMVVGGLLLKEPDFGAFVVIISIAIGILCFVLLQKFKLSVPKVIGIAAVLGLVCFGVF